ncbi:MAG: hypothetical protein JWO26_2405 [Rhodospirillales bacterium]|nr:hypothetical protein [Rhodospirillales bacterium]MDB5382773.1 hypothetical protein [Rhodospirillales bacterium]
MDGAEAGGHGQQRDGREGVVVVVGHLIEVRRDRVGAVARDDEGVAIRALPGGEVHPDGAAGAGAIVDRHGVSQLGAERRGQGAAEHVAGAARGDGHHDGDGTRGEVMGQGGARKRRCCRQGQRCMAIHHGPLQIEWRVPGGSKAAGLNTGNQEILGRLIGRSGVPQAFEHCASQVHDRVCKAMPQRKVTCAQSPLITSYFSIFPIDHPIGKRNLGAALHPHFQRTIRHE